MTLSTPRRPAPYIYIYREPRPSSSRPLSLYIYIYHDPRPASSLPLSVTLDRPSMFRFHFFFFLLFFSSFFLFLFFFFPLLSFAFPSIPLFLSNTRTF